jgi:hypothetical protein
MLSFNRDDLEARLSPLTGLLDDPRFRLTEARLEFIIMLTMKRRELLLEALDL